MIDRRLRPSVLPRQNSLKRKLLNSFLQIWLTRSLVGTQTQGHASRSSMSILVCDVLEVMYYMNHPKHCLFWSLCWLATFNFLVEILPHIKYIIVY